MTLVEFLLARIAEDEEAAQAANGPDWAPGDGDVSEGGLYCFSPGSADDRDCWSIAWFEMGETNPQQRISGQNWERRAHKNSLHAARWDPARVLAECKAKRSIVEWAQVYLVDADADGPVRLLAQAARQVLEHLASVYAAHPDYRREWAL